MADNSHSRREEPLKLLIDQVHSEKTKHYIVTKARGAFEAAHRSGTL